jgi:hypothetical protein
MTPEEYGEHLASQRKPLTEEQVEAAVRLFASIARERADQDGTS